MQHIRKSNYQMRRLEAAFDRADRESALRAQDGRCKYCLCPLTIRNVTRDHFVPRSAGGLNHRENIVAACEECNSAKRSMPAKTFMRMITDPKPGEPIRFRLIWFERNLNLALIRMEKNIHRAMGKAK